MDFVWLDKRESVDALMVSAPASQTQERVDMNLAVHFFIPRWVFLSLADSTLNRRWSTWRCLFMSGVDLALRLS